MTRTNAAIITINKKALLELLCFPNGTIHGIRTDFRKWDPGEIEIVIEHSDLPEVREGDALLKFNPTYIKRTEVVDGEEYFRIERIKE